MQDTVDILDDEQRYVEIWNLVFMQYEKTLDGKLLSAVVFVGISFYSAYMNDKIMIPTNVQNEETIGEEE